MHNQSESLKFFLLAILITLLVSLACSSSSAGGSENDLQPTIIALELTQAFLEGQTLSTDQETADIPTRIVETPPAPIKTPDVNYEGIRFSLDPLIADSVNPATIPGQNLGQDFIPGETYPTHYEFTFNRYAVSDHFHTPRILVFPVEEFRSISGFAHDQFNNLSSALVNRPGGSAMSDLPFLPLWPAAQLFSAQVSYFDFKHGSGIRYLTMFGQDTYPVDNHNLIYTYQGMTHDGRYYISAVLPITHSGLPNEGADLIGDDYFEFSNNWDTYLADTMRFLGEQPLDTFFPSMRLLDEMIASIEIDR